MPNYTQHDVNLEFIQTKGFDITTTHGLEKALEWRHSSAPDNLMLGEPTGDLFDRQMGEFRRGILYFVAALIISHYESKKLHSKRNLSLYFYQ